MGNKRMCDGSKNIRSLLNRGVPLAEFRLNNTAFRLSDENQDDNSGHNLPVRRDDIWQNMLRMVLGHVPEGAEHAPKCHCELFPLFEKCDFAGLAGLPPAVRLMDGFFPVRNQSKRGACFAFALVALCEYMLGKKVELSEQSLFHFTKLVTPGKVEQLTDGAFTLDAIHAIEEYGICPLSEWHYNPESWNYVEDPYNEGQGMALQRKLASAQKYRFRHWRTLSNGSVLQFKQALSAGFPVYTGVLVTSDWDDDDVHRTGVIPVPKLLWRIRVMPPPLGLVEEIMSDNGIDPESDGADCIKMKIVNTLIQETIEYISESVFKCGFSILECKQGVDGVELVVLLDKVRGGHALCLAGYVDDPVYQGGGYFIARNSWSDTEWAPESPEMPGYALIPYAYIAAYGQEGVVMSEFPDIKSMSCGAASRSVRLSGGSLSAQGTMGVSTALGRSASLTTRIESLRVPALAVMPVDSCEGFERWLAARSMVLDRPARDQDGVLLHSETAVIVPDPSRPSELLRDTPQNRAKLRKTFEREQIEIAAAEEKARMESAAAKAKEREDRIESVVSEVIDAAFSGNEFAILSIPELKAALLERESALAEVAGLEGRVRSAVIAMQEKDHARLWFGHGFGGVEEVRPFGKDSDRIYT